MRTAASSAALHGSARPAAVAPAGPPWPAAVVAAALGRGRRPSAGRRRDRAPARHCGSAAGTAASAGRWRRLGRALSWPGPARLGRRPRRPWPAPSSSALAAVGFGAGPSWPARPWPAPSSPGRLGRRRLAGAAFAGAWRRLLGRRGLLDRRGLLRWRVFDGRLLAGPPPSSRAALAGLRGRWPSWRAAFAATVFFAGAAFAGAAFFAAAAFAARLLHRRGLLAGRLGRGEPCLARRLRRGGGTRSRPLARRRVVAA